MRKKKLKEDIAEVERKIFQLKFIFNKDILVRNSKGLI